MVTLSFPRGSCWFSASPTPQVTPSNRNPLVFARIKGNGETTALLQPDTWATRGSEGSRRDGAEQGVNDTQSSAPKPTAGRTGKASFQLHCGINLAKSHHLLQIVFKQPFPTETASFLPSQALKPVGFGDVEEKRILFFPQGFFPPVFRPVETSENTHTQEWWKCKGLQGLLLVFLPPLFSPSCLALAGAASAPGATTALGTLLQLCCPELILLFHGTHLRWISAGLVALLLK